MVWMIFGILATIVMMICGCSLTRAGYETAAYQVSSKDSRFEIREYPALDLVSTPMAKTSNSESGSFRRLFGYISGDNEDSQKIAMTTPVFMEEGEADAQMSFVIPKDVAEKGAPEGTTASVKITKLTKGRYAVYRINGARTDKKIGAAKVALDQWLKSQDLEAAGAFIVAGYDPPFTPPMLQRNEVMVRLR